MWFTLLFHPCILFLFASKYLCATTLAMTITRPPAIYLLMYSTIKRRIAEAMTYTNVMIVFGPSSSLHTQTIIPAIEKIMAPTARAVNPHKTCIPIKEFKVMLYRLWRNKMLAIMVWFKLFVTHFYFYYDYIYFPINVK